ncbi:MAG: LysE family transporter [Bacteroidota bacterium]|nr:LysE family transporter [Bacteroidota bacterium]
MEFAILKGFSLGLLLAVSVGPIVFTVIKQSLNNGTKGGLAFIAGISFSDVCMVIIANIFTELFRSLITFKKEFAIGGSILLVAVGSYYLFFKKVAVNQEGKQEIKLEPGHYAKFFGTGILMNVFNPGIIVFWLSTATAFLDHTLQQRIVIFTIALLFNLGVDILKVVLADKIRQRLTPKNIHLINRINGIILIGFGIALVWGLLFYTPKLSH